MSRMKPPVSIDVIAMSINYEQAVEAASNCRRKADEVDEVLRAHGAAHTTPEVLRARARIYDQDAARLLAAINEATRSTNA